MCPSLGSVQPLVSSDPGSKVVINGRTWGLVAIDNLNFLNEENTSVVFGNEVQNQILTDRK